MLNLCAKVEGKPQRRYSGTLPIKKNKDIE